tara:strand:+ start:761 stop:1153 length:393 start_codon:yes stop_codon:yes gene_type:complete
MASIPCNASFEAFLCRLGAVNDGADDSNETGLVAAASAAGDPADGVSQRSSGRSARSSGRLAAQVTASSAVGLRLPAGAGGPVSPLSAAVSQRCRPAIASGDGGDAGPRTPAAARKAASTVAASGLLLPP